MPYHPEGPAGKALSDGQRKRSRAGGCNTAPLVPQERKEKKGLSSTYYQI